MKKPQHLKNFELKSIESSKSQISLPQNASEICLSKHQILKAVSLFGDFVIIVFN